MNKDKFDKLNERLEEAENTKGESVRDVSTTRSNYLARIYNKVRWQVWG
jgi:hypothetical protein